MPTRATLLFILLFAMMASLANGSNYFWVTDNEVTRLDQRVKWWHGDTLTGPIRSNSMFAVMQDPVFSDFVITTDTGFVRGTGFNPQIADCVQIITNAPRLIIPSRAQQIRDIAVANGNVLPSGDSTMTRVRLDNGALRYWSWHLGDAPDTTMGLDLRLGDSTVIWVNGPLEVYGTVGDIVILGAAGRVTLLDNIVYESSNLATHRLAHEHREKFALISESEIKIGNTDANGRDNSGGRGLSQTNQGLTSIQLDGFYFALGGEFTFEQQNDPDTGNVCAPCGCDNGGGPDDRGVLYLNGGIVQVQRGYCHRSTCMSSGYLKVFRFDEELKFWHIPVFQLRENELDRDAAIFGIVPLGTVAHDTIRITNEFVPVKFDSVRLAAGPFSIPALPDSYHWTWVIPVTFTAGAENASYFDTLHLYSRYYDRWLRIPLIAVAGEPQSAGEPVILRPSDLVLSAYPNPFNPTTLIRFSLPEAAHARLEIFDIVGRKMAIPFDDDCVAGQYAVPFDGSRWSAGVYFARLSASNRQTTAKLLLIK
jgi:hypothetical protein